MKGRTLELTQEDYWVKAVRRFKDFLPSDDPKQRLVQLSPADELLILLLSVRKKKWKQVTCIIRT